jgi:hypothetical protein
VLGLGDDIRAGRGEERVERISLRDVEHPACVGDAFDLVEETVTLGAIACLWRT